MPRKAHVRSRSKFEEPEIEEQIRQRAYVFYEGRGKGDGCALDDWLQAEKEVLALRKAKAAATSS
ncbi:MAG: DUF2934 domain-containing protein [Candidatus Sulfotelmatobacter sp.]